jgi:hypothetical protein
MNPSVAKPSDDFAVIGNLIDVRWQAALGRHLLGALHLKSRFGGRLHGCVEEVANYLVAYGSDPDTCAPSNKFADHLRAGERLPSPWRSLNS